MKNLQHYLAESLNWMHNPAKGDAIGIELADGTLIESWIMETADDGILLAPSKRRIGILLGSLVTIAFSILDTAGKWLSTHIPLIEIVWLRFAIAAIIALIIVLPKTNIKTFYQESFKTQCLRAVMMMSMTFLNFAGLKYLQLAQANAILFSSPIIIGLISSIFLKEKLHYYFPDSQ